MANTTDKSILTAAGKALLAQLNAEEKPLIIDKMIFANVPSRPEFPQPDDVVPTEHIVHQEGVEQRGRLSADSVIYSTTLTSSVGPFDFNWTGAYCSEYGVLVTIDHHALTPKTADQPGISGNTLVRSVVLEYKDIAEITNITVDASSWQYNAVPRMKKMDDDVAQAIIDQNGKDWFIEEGFLVTPQASAFNIKAGAGYVSGNRVTLEFDRSVQVPNKPSFIYVDARREGTPTGEQVTLFDFVVTAEEKDDYIDSSTGKDVKHFVCKIAQVHADGSVSDLRPEGESASKNWTSNNYRDLERASTYLNTFSDLLGYKPREGEVIKTRGYYQKGDGGGGTYVALDAPDLADNLGGVIDFSNGLKGFLEYESRVNPLQFGAISGNNLTVDQQNDNTRRIQACLDFSLKVKFSRKFEYGGSLKITTGHSFKGVNRSISGLTSVSLFEAAIKDTAVDQNPGHGTNTTAVDIRKLSLSSEHQDVIHCRPYMWFIELNQFRCPKGKAFHMDGNSYQVENNIRKNYFYGCKYGIYGLKGTHGPTDQYIVDNWFYGNGVQFCAIKLQSLSGSTIRGNHVYGGAKEYMMDLAEGDNVSVSDNYFEDDVRPRLKITAGNPGTWAINGNKFWGGDGSQLDTDGEERRLIDVFFSPWTKAELVFSGNIFSKGQNNVKIFKINHSTHEQDVGQEIKLGQNVYNGSYELGEGTGRVHSEELFFFSEELTEQSPFSALENPLTIYKHVGHSEGWLSIPNNKSLSDLTKRIWNKSPNCVLNISTSKTIVGKKQLQPGEMIKITFDYDDDCYYSFLG